MTVKELIEKLKDHDPSAMVVVDGYEDGLDEARSVHSTKLELNFYSDWWYGEHEETGCGDTDAVVIR